MTDVAVLEKGWLGGGKWRATPRSSARTTCGTSGGDLRAFAQALGRARGELDFDVQLSQRGVVNLAHDLGDVRAAAAGRGEPAERRRRGMARAGGREGALPDRRTCRPTCGIRCSARRCNAAAASPATTAWPGGTRARADSMGVDIVQHCEVTGFLRGDGGRVEGVETTRGTIRARKVALAAAGHTSVLASMVDLRLPLQTHPLQALVSVLLEPILDCVVMSNAVHVYVSQADKGELVMGAGIDPYNGYAQRGSFHVIEHQIAAAVELFPIFAHAKLCGHGPASSTCAPDASPIIGLTPVEGSTSIAAGDRRIQGDARVGLGLRATRSRTASRTHSRRRTRSSGSRPERWSTSTAPRRSHTDAFDRDPADASEDRAQARARDAGVRGARDLGDGDLPGAEQDLRHVRRGRERGVDQVDPRRAAGTRRDGSEDVLRAPVRGAEWLDRRALPQRRCRRDARAGRRGVAADRAEAPRGDLRRGTA